MAYNKLRVLENNIKAIELVLSGKELTEEDKAIIRGYQGFGGIKSVLLPPDNPDLFPNADKVLVPLVNDLHDVLKKYSADTKEYDNYLSSVKNSVLTSFFTPEPIVKAITGTLDGVHFNKILEPSAGVGVFIKNIVATEKTAVEKDLLTGKLLKALYPDNEVLIHSFQNIPPKNEDSFDLVISNIPFGNIPVFDALYAQRKDKDRKKATGAVHSYFFMKGLDMLKDGGLLAFITSAGVMDSPGNEFLRKALLKEAHLISCVRLPDNLFQNTGGIEVKSDLIVLQKDLARSKSLTASEKLFIHSDGQINNYYQDLRHVVFTRGEFTTNQFGKSIPRHYHDGGEDAIAEDVKKLLEYDFKQNFIKSIFKEEFVQVETVVSQKQPKVKGSSMQLSLFDDVEHFATTFEQKLPKKAPEQIAFEKYQAIYDAYYELKDTEGRRNIAIPGLRQTLNDLYDSFVDEYGYLSLIDNYLIDKDPYINELRGLEVKQQKEIRKADIFFEPVNIRRQVSNISIEDALSTSLNELNYVDLDYISQLSGENKERIKQTLLGNSIYFNPFTGSYEPSNFFLSGNVISKFNDIREYTNSLELHYNPESEDYFTAKNELDISMNALESVIPERIPLEEIGLNLGERWIPERYYVQFSKFLFNPPGTEERLKNYTDVKYLPSSDDYALKMVNNSSMSYAYNKFTVKTANRTYYPEAVLHFAMMDNVPDMTKTIMRDGEEVKVPDTEGIQKMHSAIEEIRNSFQEWISKIHQSNKEELEIIYNNKFNNIVKAHYDGSFQTFPDLNYENLGIEELYSTQKDAILMLKQNGGGIIDHEVGGGKTLIQVVASYEMKRLGIAKKPMIIGLKANVHEIASTYMRAYPQAKILYPTQAELKKDSIDIFLSKIQNNNWDAIIMSHEQFEKIPQSFEIQQSIINEELRKLHDTMISLVEFDSEAEERRAYKNLESTKERLTTRLEFINEQLLLRKSNTIVDFKTMGIDHLFVDESQKYKNLGFITKHNRVAGLGNQKGSQRAQNMLYAIRTIQDKTGKDLQASFLSGTTIDNSLTELYNIFNYLRPEALKQQGILSMDGWLATYAIKSKEFEFSVTNDIIQKERFRFFCKVPELAAFYAEITDYKTADIIGIDRPQKNEILVKLKQTSDQEDMYARLKIFAKEPDGPLIFRKPLSYSEEKAKMLIATNTAKNAALDMRLVDPRMFEDHEGNKINACVNNIIEYYNRFDKQRGSQFVFSDLGTFSPDKEWDVYSEIKRKLIAYGIPEHEIQFIQNFKTDKKKIEFQKEMNEGHIRVGLGSTEMLGTGVNAQQRAVAVHHLDVPWTPKSFIQRDGRAVRKGNWVAKEHADNKVDVFIYAVEKTLDVYKFNLQATKNRFISQIKSQTIGVRVIDEGAGDDKTGMSYNEYIAVLSGDTSLLEKSKLERRISQLKNEEKLFLSNIRNRETFIRDIKTKIVNSQEVIDKLQSDLDKYRGIPRDEKDNIIYKVDLIVPSIKENQIFLIDNAPINTYENVKEAGIALNSLVEVVNVSQDKYQKIGDFYGFNIGMMRTGNMLSAENRFVLYTDSNLYYKHNNGIMPRTLELAGEFIYKSLERIENNLDKQKEKVSDLNNELAGLLAITGTVYPKKEELIKLEAEYKSLVQKIERCLGSKNQDNNQLSI